MKFPYTLTRSEVKRVVSRLAKNQPNCRIGQAVCNQTKVPKELEDLIYECDEFLKVVDRIWKHFHRPEYHNL